MLFISSSIFEKIIFFGLMSTSKLSPTTLYNIVGGSGNIYFIISSSSIISSSKSELTEDNIVG